MKMGFKCNPSDSTLHTLYHYDILQLRNKNANRNSKPFRNGDNRFIDIYP